MLFCACRRRSATTATSTAAAAAVVGAPARAAPPTTSTATATAISTKPMASRLTRIASSALSPAEASVFRTLGGVAPLWITGGWVRDKLLEQSAINPAAGKEWSKLRELLGHRSSTGDLDILVDVLSAQDFHRQCRKQERLRSVLIPAKGKRPMDVVKIRLQGLELDVTSLVDARKKLSLTSSLSGEAVLRVDAEHRDTTFNALYYQPESEEVYDPTGQGISDLQDGLVRMPLPAGPGASLDEDPLRLLRVFRFSARFGFKLDAELIEVLTSLSDGLSQSLLQRVSLARLLNEIKKGLLLHNRPTSFLTLLGSPGEAYQHFIGPEFASLGPSGWKTAVKRVSRLEALVLEGLTQGHLQGQSLVWRGRKSKEKHSKEKHLKDSLSFPLPLLLTESPRKEALLIRENDWVELLFAALLWDVPELSMSISNGKPPAWAERLEVSMEMSVNVTRLQKMAQEAKTSMEPLGPSLLRSAVIEETVPADFWRSLPMDVTASAR
eukprot:TRINITY_DN6162_c0_g2_i1.p1 TRINITY_DN6162_c0_g2~~TRINITY_DN6162_c0_g2_i1.p1  ORF type:complete len:496 (-),score=73.48 TRINITY_DN6162_c0_g2_i1:163-1650(-)